MTTEERGSSITRFNLCGAPLALIHLEHILNILNLHGTVTIENAAPTSILDLALALKLKWESLK